MITAHSGMASNRMFSDLPELEKGDVFFLHILGRRLGYRVDQIKVTLPEETEALRMEREKDLCTLVTCTPFGINTHRLLVRGERIPDAQLEAAQQQAEEQLRHAGGQPSVWESEYIRGIWIGLAIVAGMALLLTACRVIEKKRKQK